MFAVDLPLPIPNREVKPERADGTAIYCGRVGSRLCFVNSTRYQYNHNFKKALFYLLI